MSMIRTLLAVLALLLTVAGSQAAPLHPPGVIKPKISCADLAHVTLGEIAGTAVTITATTETGTDGAAFCKVEGSIAPSIGFEVDLPLTRWTQRYVQTGCGGLCGSISVAIEQASSCAPALNGEFAVASTNLGYTGGPGQPLGSFASDPQKRIDFAYRATHATAQAAKALIKAFYGQAARYSYFSGCSDGGREALMEAQRYPDDFDGISAGAPVMNFQVQNSFYHAWVVAANRRADGSPILLQAKLPLLHQAVLEHCDGLDGLRDGLLSDPRACKADPAWVPACAAKAADTSACLTAEEAAVVRRIYQGPVDPASGKSFLVGGPQPGSELQWDFIARDSSSRSMSAMLGTAMRRSMIFPASPSTSPLVDNFKFDAATFAAVTELHGLNDATNPDLRPFARHGGKLIMWHGWSDTSVSPITSVAYFKAVQQVMGAGPANDFMRLFMLPGTGHCGGGDGFSQIDTLTALMDWVEADHAPAQLVAGKVADRSDGPRGGLPGGPQRASPAPLAKAAEPALETRPIFPFPAIAIRRSGAFIAGVSPAPEPAAVDWYGAGLFKPGFQQHWHVEAGKLIAE